MQSKKEDSITIRFEDDTVTECSSAIIIPERAMIEAGYIRTLTTNSTAHSKHEFHTIAQCVFHAIPATDSITFRPPIPRNSGH